MKKRHRTPQSAGSMQVSRSVEHRELTIQCFDFPQDKYEIVQQALDQTIFLIPAWCVRLSVRYVQTPSDPGNVSRVHTNYPYRWASVEIHKEFFDEDMDPLEIMVHELLHIALAPAHDWAMTAIRENTSELLSKSLSQEFNDRIEMTTTDLESAIARKLVTLKDGEESNS